MVLLTQHIKLSCTIQEHTENKTHKSFFVPSWDFTLKKVYILCIGSQVRAESRKLCNNTKTVSECEDNLFLLCSQVQKKQREVITLNNDLSSNDNRVHAMSEHLRNIRQELQHTQVCWETDVVGLIIVTIVILIIMVVMMSYLYTAFKTFTH